MFSRFLLFFLFVRISLAGLSPGVCTTFFLAFDGQFKYPTENQGIQKVNHHLYARMAFTMKEQTIFADLSDEVLGNQQYLSKLTVVSGDGTLSSSLIQQCKGFWRDGKDDCSISFKGDIKEYKFELCFSEDECELFFRAVIKHGYFFPATNFTADGNEWQDLQCSSYIDFGDNYQPPNIEYCTCCNGMGFDDKKAMCSLPKPPSHLQTGSTEKWFSMTTKSTWNDKSTTTQASWSSAETTIESPIDDVTNCTDPSGIRAQYCDNTTLTNSTVGDFINNVTESLNPQTATYKDVFWLSHIFQRIANVDGLNENDSKQLYQLFDKTLDIQEKHFYETNANVDSSTSTRILQSVDQFLTNVELNLNLLDAQNLAMRKFHYPVDCSKTDFVELSDDGSSFKDSKSKSTVASINVPNEIACSNGRTVPLYLIAYRKTQFFLPIRQKPPLKQKMADLMWHKSKDTWNSEDYNDEYNETTGNRCKTGLYSERLPVLSATIIGSTQDKDNAVKARLRFSAKNVKASLHGTHIVSWWSLKQQDWSTKDQCKTKEVNGFYTAECYHLTDFSLLADKSPSDPILCNPTLIILGYVLVIGSAVCLLIMMGVQFLNLSKSARIHATKFFETFPSMRFRVELIGFIYTTMLFLFYLFFGIFSDGAHISNKTVCSVFGAVSYFLLLSCICLTIFQAWRVLKLFAWSSKMENVLAFITRNIVIIVLSFFIPIAISLIGFLAEPNLFNRDDDFCWINASDIVWAVIFPLSLLFLNGLICVIVVIVRLFPRSGCLKSVFGRLVRTNTNIISQGERRTRMRDKLLYILNMQFLLGLPWALQYLTLFSKKATMWHYLFTIVNGSQGIILFALFVYRRIRARRNNLTTLTSTSQNNGETQQATLTETRDSPDDTSVKLRHPPAKQIMSLPTPRNIYENDEYAHAPSVPTHNRSHRPNLPPKPDNSISKTPHPDGNQPTNLAKNMYIY